MTDQPDIERFVRAQEDVYDDVIRELRAGEKRSHWIWFVFPQIVGLGITPTSKYYSIRSMDEAQDYLVHPLLGSRLAECTDAMLDWSGKRSSEMILGEIDAMKFVSSMTLFEAAGGPTRFAEALDTFNSGGRDELTLEILAG